MSLSIRPGRAGVLDRLVVVHAIHEWTTAQVWRRVAAAGTRVHPAYAAGMTRLSCRFCILASRADLVTSARLNPELADRYAATEAATGHRFRLDLSMADIIAEARPQGPAPHDRRSAPTLFPS